MYVLISAYVLTLVLLFLFSDDEYGLCCAQRLVYVGLLYEILLIRISISILKYNHMNFKSCLYMF